MLLKPSAAGYFQSNRIGYSQTETFWTKYLKKVKYWQANYCTWMLIVFCLVLP